MKKFVVAALQIITAVCSAATLDNLALQSGVKASADSQLYDYAPAKAIDGNDKDKASRWVSASTNDTHWFQIDFAAPQKINTVWLKFWNDGYVAVDYTVLVKVGDSWQKAVSVTGNEEVTPQVVFATVECTAVKITFDKITPDSMVRIYEVGVGLQALPIELKLTGDARGIWKTTENKCLLIRNFDRTPGLELTVKTVFADQSSGQKEEKTAKVKLDGELALPVAPPHAFGAYEVDIEVATADGKAVKQLTESIFYLPANPSQYKTTSGFGSHYHAINDALVDYLGIYWWRNHDLYGRWNNYVDNQGNVSFKGLDERLDFVKKNQVRECSVFLGAPLKYSTIFPTEAAASNLDEVYSLYTPTDFEAWKNEYIKTVVEKVKTASPFRAYEVWNEAWSYFRLRGLRGTPGEAMQLFRESYQYTKNLDPESLVYPTDTKPESVSNPYGFRNFGPDMMQLGMLRWADLFSFHTYGPMTQDKMSAFRRTMWDFGRDMDMWSTETAVEGSPYYELMESLCAHKSGGCSKIFIYSGNLWAPLYLNGKPTMNLAVMAVLLGNLGDALPVGVYYFDRFRLYTYVNGGETVGAVFTDSAEAIPLTADFAGAKTVDLFGNQGDAATAKVSQKLPLIVRNLPEILLKKVVANELLKIADANPDAGLDDLLNRIINRLNASPELPTDVALTLDTVTKFRHQTSHDTLYYANLTEDVLFALQMMYVRKSGKTVADIDPAQVQGEVAAMWQEINAKTKGDGSLLNCERLTSRAQKQLQFAREYRTDKDFAAANLLLAAARDNLKNSQDRFKAEKVYNIYKSKIYFRAAKRQLRSELFCFGNGQAQKAVITLANPFGRELTGKLKISVPANWEVAQKEVDYQVPAYSRTLLECEITAPKEFKVGDTYKIVLTDLSGNFPETLVDCEIVAKVPPHPQPPVTTSTGTYTGN